MRWMWIDRIVLLEAGSRCVAVKNVSLAEEHLRDHFPAADGRPAMPIHPAPLLVEGMAQTAGILVGHARDFAERVILAKITKAAFDFEVTPGQTVFFDARLQRIDEAGAATSGSLWLVDHGRGDSSPAGDVTGDPPIPAAAVRFAEIELMFSHVDNLRTGLELPDHNFVFTDQFFDLLRQCGVSVPSDT